MARNTTALGTLPSPPHWLQANGWEQFPGLVHGFSGQIRDRAQVAANIEAQQWDLRTLTQVHGDDMLFVTSDTQKNNSIEADGLSTQSDGILLGIATADCVPVLLVAPQKKVVAALHAGWRGTLKGITARALTLLSSTWSVVPSEVWMACGPAIGRCCYEVGRDVGEALYERWGKSDPETWQPKGEKGQLDLRLLNLLQGEHCGVPRAQMQLVGACTFCDAELFTSYRREGTTAGRQLSVIGWQKVSENL